MQTAKMIIKSTQINGYSGDIALIVNNTTRNNKNFVKTERP